MYTDALDSTGLIGTNCGLSLPSSILQVYNDALDSTGLLGSYCGSSPPSSIFTGSNVAYLRFISDDTVTGAGFKARYQTQCELILTDTSGSFTSIDSDQDGYSDSYQNCTWIISGGDYKVVRLEITELDIHLVNTDLCSRSNIKDVFQVSQHFEYNTIASNQVDILIIAYKTFCMHNLVCNLHK